MKTIEHRIGRTPTAGALSICAQAEVGELERGLRHIHTDAQEDIQR